MVSGISSNLASLYERINAAKEAMNLKPSCIANIKANPISNFINKLHFSPKEDFINFCTYSPSNVDSLGRYISLRQNLSNTTGLTNEDYEKESINKWSDQVDAYNKALRGINPQSPKYNASLIANYQK